MRAFSILLFSFLGLLAGCAGDKWDVPPANEPNVLSVPKGFPDMPFPPDNEFSYARWTLGKKLFYDPVLSVDQSISCASCHQAGLAFADDKVFSDGAFQRPGVRNAPSLANIGYHPYFMREGAVPTLEMQVLVPVQEHNEFAHNIVDIAEMLAKDPEYVELSRQAYGRNPDPFVITRAISTFERSLISGNSPYDRYVFQEKSAALSATAKRGMELFFSDEIGCSGCHSGFNFTNYSFQNNGLDTVYTDPGRMRLTGNPADAGLFKVPSLRNVALTAPYMHNGRMETLEEVVAHYNSGGQPHPNKSPMIKPLQLSPQQQAELVAFLHALSDHQFIHNPLLK